MEILGLDKIKKISDNTDLESDVQGLDMIRSDGEGISITGLDSIKPVFFNNFPKLSTFAIELMSLVSEAKELDTEFRQYGSERHRYEFAPVIPMSEIRDFELRHSIKLPESYVEFLTQVGNGGAGPDFGLLSLQELEFRNFISHSNRNVSYSMAMCESDYRTFSFTTADRPVMLDAYLTEQKWDNACLELLKLDGTERTDEYEKERRALYNGVLQIVDTDSTFCPVLICEGNMRGEMSEFSHDLDMPRYLGKTFEDYITDYFKDVISKFGHK